MKPADTAKPLNLILDRATLEALENTKLGEDKTGLDLLPELASQPGITVIIPSIVADFILRKQVVTVEADGTETMTRITQVNGNGTKTSEAIKALLAGATRRALPAGEEDHLTDILPKDSTPNDIIIYEGFKDREFAERAKVIQNDRIVIANEKMRSCTNAAVAIVGKDKCGYQNYEACYLLNATKEMLKSTTFTISPHVEIMAAQGLESASGVVGAALPDDLITALQQSKFELTPSSKLKSHVISSNGTTTLLSALIEALTIKEKPLGKHVKALEKKIEDEPQSLNQIKNSLKNLFMSPKGSEVGTLGGISNVIDLQVKPEDLKYQIQDLSVLLGAGNTPIIMGLDKRTKLTAALRDALDYITEQNPKSLEQFDTLMRGLWKGVDEQKQKRKDRSL